MKEALDKFLGWWAGQEPRGHAGIFGQDLVVVSESRLLPAAEWLALIDRGVPPVDVSVLGTVCEERRGSVFLEFTDPVTLLRRRTAFHIETDGRIIAKIIQVSSVLG